MSNREVREALADAIFAATDDPGIWQSGNVKHGVETIHIDGAVDVAGVLRALKSTGWQITPDYLERAKQRLAEPDASGVVL